MGKVTKGKGAEKKVKIDNYDHKDKQRVNNPPVGLVTPDTDKDTAKKTYQYDPHLDPQLVWAGKAEHTAFEVPTVSLHVHERIDPRSIIESVRKTEGKDNGQLSLFEQEKIPFREVIEFYKHKQNWTNRLIAGDSLLVMNSLIEKEGMAGQVQMVYIDPPYGIKYGSNFQPFVNKRDVKDKDEDLTQEPEMIKAFRDTWELGIHSYLTYLRDRLLLARELLTDSGSCFVQISDENMHLIRNLMDEIFDINNFVSVISYASTSGFATNTISRAGDYVIWYAKDKKQLKYRQLYVPKEFGGEGSSAYSKLELADGRRLSIAEWEKETGENFIYNSRPKGSRVYGIDNITSQGPAKDPQPFKFNNLTFYPKAGNHWKANYPDGMERLKEIKRIDATGKSNIGYVRYFDDFPYMEINNLWKDTLGQNQYGAEGKKYVVQTSLSVVQRCLLMCTDPGDLVFDPTCGSGSTAYIAEQWGRRWITCDTSRVAITLAKQRIMTSTFDYYELAHQFEGIGSGLKYKQVPHIKLEDLANNEPSQNETLYDQPLIDKSKIRVTGPFTVEAVPAPMVKPISEITGIPASDESVARTGETDRQSQYRDKLLREGIRGKGGQRIMFSRVETLSGTRWLQADAETKDSKRAVFCFGPEHSPLEQRFVALAVQESLKLVPNPELIIFAAYQFDPEAAKDIDETNYPGKTLLKVQMNMDLQTEDLKKKTTSGDSFWLIGQPDVELEKITDGEDKGKYRVKVNGFDYYDTKNGTIISGDAGRIAVWMLDTDYDERSLLPRQVFFPMSGANEGWAKLAKTLKAEIDEEKLEAFRGNVSLPFSKGSNGQIAVKIVDDRGIESLKIMEIK